VTFRISASATREEYALARTERKQGRGHRGFEFFASPDVTLEQDLERRDITINAMARDENGTLIDPFGGSADLSSGVLRHVSSSFSEDPLRVLRVARFAARFDFVVAPETEALMRDLSASGELAELSPERVWQELSRGLMEEKPSRMLAVLRDCGALAALLPEIDALFGVPQPVTHHPEVDVGVHVALALDYAAAHGVPLAVRYAVLTHDLGKAGSPAADWPKHHGHEARSVRLVERMSTRLRAPAECRDVARLVARWHGVIRSVAELRPTTLLEIFTAADALRRPERLDLLLAACECDSMSRPGADGEYAPAHVLRSAFDVVRAVDVAAIARRVSAAAQADAAGEAIASAIRAARIKALRTWRNARREAAGATSH
jgi:tRNA nucleotidyltransferase (CCA-adding enzyme)